MPTRTTSLWLIGAVFWSDESKFNLEASGWKAQRSKAPSSYCQAWGGSIMTWDNLFGFLAFCMELLPTFPGCFSRDGVCTPLVRVEGKMNAEAYKSILDDNCLSRGAIEHAITCLTTGSLCRTMTRSIPPSSWRSGLPTTMWKFWSCLLRLRTSILSSIYGKSWITEFAHAAIPKPDIYWRF